MKTLHVIGLPWTQTTKRYLHCAYTQKVLKFCDMMHPGNRVVLYAGDENEAKCDEHVACFTEAERETRFGPWDPNGTFHNIAWGPDEEAWRFFNGRVLAEILPRAEPGDLLLPVAGWSSSPVAQALGSRVRPVEWAVGYPGILDEWQHVFESYAWMHYVYGQRQYDGRAYDTVIPNFFDPEDFYFEPTPDEYLLFMGRVVQRKGPAVAAAIAERVGLPLYVAGPGVIASTDGHIIAEELEIKSERMVYCGSADWEERRELMAGARAIIVPTLYVEPFGGVAVEAMLSGTPVVASDWGAFTETVTPDVGRRFSTIAEGVTATQEAMELDRGTVFHSALDRFSLEAVRPQFEAYFNRLDTLNGDGYYA